MSPLLRHFRVWRWQSSRMSLWIVKDICGVVCILLTWLLLVFAEFVMWTCILLPSDDHHHSFVHGVIFQGFTCLAAVSHIRAMFTNPGAVIRGNATKENISAHSASTKSQVIYRCPKCNSIKPNRAHHCSVCRRCIRKMDHHCPWINNCVGENNQKFFILFTMYICIISIHAFYLTIRHLVVCSGSQKKGGSSVDTSSALTTVLTVLLLFESVLFSIFTGVMFGSQLCHFQVVDCMELRTCAEWQHGKSLKECNKYMLENEIATDVCFEVGPRDGHQGLVRAHKYILIARSAVFEAMFCGGMSESKADANSKIPITDVEVEIFEELLRFMYCEEATVSTETALPLMYAAKKYLLLDLVDQCQKFLQANLNIENVCCILELSMAFDENQLKDRCLAFISKYTIDVLKSEGFLQLSRATLLEIAKMDCLTISELQLFNACVLWAKHQLRPDATDLVPTPLMIRNALDGVLYRIRFTNMDQVEFSRHVGKCQILSNEERLSLYYYFNTKEDKDVLPFDTTPRRMHEDVISRFTSVSSGEWIMNGKVDAIDFVTDKDIILIGLGIYGSPSSAVHDISIEIWTGKILLCIVATKFESFGQVEPIKVGLGQKVRIKANTNNTIVAMIKGPNTHYGCNGEKRVVSGGVTFTFSPSQKCAGRSGLEVGQIPQLYFTSY